MRSKDYIDSLLLRAGLDPNGVRDITRALLSQEGPRSPSGLVFDSPPEDSVLQEHWANAQYIKAARYMMELGGDPWVVLRAAETLHASLMELYTEPMVNDGP